MFRTALLALCLSVLSLIPARAATIETAATSAIVIDMNSGAVLLSKDPDKPIPPASMSKLMTVYMVFEALKEGRLSMDDEFTVSEKAWRMGGSKMFVKVGESIKIRDLLRGVIVQSGNDACVVLAEGLAGSEEAFAKRMTEKAKEIGLKTSRFRNATGLPDVGHQMSVRDLATLAQIIIREFPEYYAIYSEREFTWEGIAQQNRNPLLRFDIGADGLKTGYTEEAGYCLVGSATLDERRLVMVIAGLPSVQVRALEGERLLKWGFREFETVEVLKPGATLGTADVWIGENATVPLVVEDGLTLTTGFGQAEDITAEIRYDGPVAAPVEQGQQIATLRVTAPDIEPVNVPLVAGKAVGKGGFMVRLKSVGGMMLSKGLSAAMGGGEKAAE